MRTGNASAPIVETAQIKNMNKKHKVELAGLFLLFVAVGVLSLAVWTFVETACRVGRSTMPMEPFWLQFSTGAVLTVVFFCGAAFVLQWLCHLVVKCFTLIDEAAHGDAPAQVPATEGTTDCAPSRDSSNGHSE